MIFEIANINHFVSTFWTCYQMHL